MSFLNIIVVAAVAPSCLLSKNTLIISNSDPCSELTFSQLFVLFLFFGHVFFCFLFFGQLVLRFAFVLFGTVAHRRLGHFFVKEELHGRKAPRNIERRSWRTFFRDLVFKS